MFRNKNLIMSIATDMPEGDGPLWHTANACSADKGFEDRVKLGRDRTAVNDIAQPGPNKVYQSEHAKSVVHRLVPRTRIHNDQGLRRFPCSRISFWDARVNAGRRDAAVERGFAGRSKSQMPRPSVRSKRATGRPDGYQTRVLPKWRICGLNVPHRARTGDKGPLAYGREVPQRHWTSGPFLPPWTAQVTFTLRAKFPRHARNGTHLAVRGITWSTKREAPRGGPDWGLLEMSARRSVRSS